MIKTVLFVVLILFYSPASNPAHDEWGFFGHRRINRLAVFTLPMEMMPFYKEHIDFITDHAIDPDKRRYASRHEGVRHYIDLDIWGKPPFDNLPRKWTEAIACYSDLYLITHANDTISVYKAGSHNYSNSDSIHFTIFNSKIPIHFGAYRDWFQKKIMPNYYEDVWNTTLENFQQLVELDIVQQKKIKQLLVIDRFSEHGILPYHLIQAQKRLTEAFKNQDLRMILRLSTDFGHYIGDAHVPLHTTKNYNGQLTNQDGIHAFWESRIPELFADEQFDFFVGKATYIADPESYYWNVVLESHASVDSVLQIEKQLRKTFPEDMQMCYDNRMGQTVRTQCREFAEAYNKALKGQIEERFRSSIHTIGSAWYTAWIDAGQPPLTTTNQPLITEADKEQIEKEEKLKQQGEIKGRPHDN
jgi:hypothetical protein